MVDLSIKQVDPASGWIAAQDGLSEIAEQWVRGIGDNVLEVVCSGDRCLWRVDVCVLEYLCRHPLYGQIEAAITADLLQVPGVRDAERFNRENWSVKGYSSGREVMRAVAAVLDRFAAQARVVLDAHDVWSLAAPSFQHDDGSLPEVELGDLLPSEGPMIFAFLRDRFPIDETSTFWDEEQKEDRLVSSVENPVAMMASGRVPNFNVLLSEVTVAGAVLPPLNFFWWYDFISMDYRMGEEWGESQVLGLFTLLKEIISLTQSATLRLNLDDLPPPFPRMFMDAWRRFNA